MDWNAIILAAVAFLFSWETISNIRYRRENKKLKLNEVKTSDVDTQRQEIDLAVHFKEEMLTMMKQMSDKQDGSNDSQQRILMKIDKLEDKMDNIETYLNGKYHEWLAKQENGDQEMKTLVDELEDDHEQPQAEE